MARYTVKDNATKKTVTFEWDGDAPPTDSDMAEVFSAARTSSRKEYSPAEAEQMRRKFVADEGTLLTRAKEALPSRQTLANIARPTLEAGGAVGGGIIGAAGGALAGLGIGSIPGATVGGVTGAGLGYAMGKNIADNIEGTAGGTAGQMTARTLKDIGTGAAFEMGGQVVAKGAGYALTKAGQAVNAARRATPAVTRAGIQRRAGQVIEENTGAGAAYEKNAAEAAKLKIPGYKPSMGEARNDPGLIKLQRGIEAQTGTAGNIIAEQKAANQSAIRDYLQNEFKGGESIDDVVNALTRKKSEIEAATKQAGAVAESARSALNPADTQSIGRGITDTLDESLKPLKQAEREAWREVPNYPIPTSTFDDVAEQLRATPMEADTESAVLKILDYAKRMPKTTEGLQSIERTIGDKMFAPNADPNVKRILGQLKSAITEDFRLMGEAAEAGDVALSAGKVVQPSKLQSELYNIDERILAAQRQAAPDLDAMSRELMAQGQPAMKQMGENIPAYTARLTKDYERVFRRPIPTKTDGKNISDLLERRNALAEQIGGLEPADDVAKSYRAAKDVSKQRFDRFGKGEVEQVMRKGNQATGRNIPDALIPKRVFSSDGADDFIRAVGKNKAATHADQYAAQDLLSKANPLTGELDTKTAAGWLKKNMQILRKYGISEKYSTVAKAQARFEIAKAQEVEFTKSAASRILNSDVDKALSSAFSSNPSNTAAVVDGLIKQIGADKQGVKGLQNSFKDFLMAKVETTAKTISGDPIISPAAIQKQLVKYAPAMRRLYANEPGKIVALNKVARAVEIQGRSARTPVAGSSSTAENLNVARSILGRTVDLIPGSGLVKGLARMGLGRLNDLSATEVNKVIARALYDPDLAQTLYMAARRRPAAVVEKRINSHLVTMGIVTVFGNKNE